jgi:hypothetical protein
VGILNQNCGPGSYDYVVHVPAGALDATGLLGLADAFDEHEDAEDEDAKDEDDNFEYEDEDNTIEGFVNINRASDSDR